MNSFTPVLSIGTQIAEAVRAHPTGLDRAGVRARVDELLRDAGFTDPERIRKAYPHELSGGQLQRAMIAMALAGDPVALFADEPTTALDVTVQAGILDLLRRLGRERSLAVLLITHDMGVVADVADDLLVLRRGDPVEHGTVAEVFAHPTADYTREPPGGRPQPGGAPRLRRAARVDRDSACRTGCGLRRPRSVRSGESRTGAGRPRSGEPRLPAARGAPARRRRAVLAPGRTDRVRHRPRPARRRDRGPGGRIRFRQVHDRACARGAGARRRRLGRGGRQRPAHRSRTTTARAAQSGRHRVPGPGVVAQPATDHRLEHRGTAARARYRLRRRPRRAGPNAADRRPARPDVGGAVPAPAVGRTAAARRRRTCARTAAGTPHRRRTDLGTRRDGAGRRARPARRAAAGVRLRHAAHQSRPRRRPPARRPGDRAARRPGRRAGSTDAVLDDPQQDYTRMLLAAAPVADPVRQAARREAWRAWEGVAS